jgi:D-3-phosphoglycerate dehydrogenase / 2-oxoglutarate reductase
MPPFKVVLVANDLPPTPDWVGRTLAEQGIELVERSCTGASEVVETAVDADVVWTMGGSRVITAQVLPLLRKCRVILRTGTGTDNIPVAEASRLGIVVANTPEATMHQVAEHAISLMFAVIRQIARQDKLVRQGIWDRHRAWPNWHLVGQTFGLVGFGRIARLVARKISGFELKIIACDPLVDRQAMEEHGALKVSLDELLSRSDYVSIHVPLSDQARHTIGERELRLMKPTTVLINTARGEIVDQRALVRALTEGWIAAAGLDVLDPEPPAPDDPILSLENVVLTPHIASYSDVFREGFWRHSVETLVAMAQQGMPRWVVNPAVVPWWHATAPFGDCGDN